MISTHAILKYYYKKKSNLLHTRKKTVLLQSKF